MPSDQSYQLSTDRNAPIMSISIHYSVNSLKERMNSALSGAHEFKPYWYDRLHSSITILCKSKIHDVIKEWVEDNLPKCSVSDKLWFVKVLDLTHVQIYVNNEQELEIFKKHWLVGL